MSDPNCVNGRCLIPGGLFPDGPSTNEQRQVNVATFKVGETEVSVGEYKQYLAKRSGVLSESQGLPMNGSCGEMNGMGDEYPVVCLNMHEKREYCQAQGGDLMTVAQFEYAARFDMEDSRSGQMIVWQEGQKAPAIVPVRSGYQNRFGVFNLRGNVWESMRGECSDAYEPRPALNDFRTNLQGCLEEFRGGSFVYGASLVGSAIYFGITPIYRYNDVGFRCVWQE